MQLVIGIDLGKRRHHATALTAEGKVGFTLGFSADATGFARFLARLGQCADPSTTVMVGMEATGHY